MKLSKGQYDKRLALRVLIWAENPHLEGSHPIYWLNKASVEAAAALLSKSAIKGRLLRALVCLGRRPDIACRLPPEEIIEQLASRKPAPEVGSADYWNEFVRFAEKRMRPVLEAMPTVFAAAGNDPGRMCEIIEKHKRLLQEGCGSEQR